MKFEPRHEIESKTELVKTNCLESYMSKMQAQVSTHVSFSLTYFKPTVKLDNEEGLVLVLLFSRDMTTPVHHYITCPTLTLIGMTSRS